MTPENIPEHAGHNDLQTVLAEYAAVGRVSAVDTLMIQHRINLLAATAPVGHEVDVRQVVEHYFSDIQPE